MWISVRCGCGGSNGYCCHCGGLGFTWRISTTEMQAESDNQCIEWMTCPLCSVRIHRGSFLAHVEIRHQTTWEAFERFAVSMTSLSSQQRLVQQPAGYGLSGNVVKRINNDLNLAIEHLIPSHYLLRLVRNLSSPKRHAHSDEAKSTIVFDYLLP